MDTRDAEKTRRGSGEGSSPPPTKWDCKLVELALRERWEIPDTTRAALMRELASVIEEPGIIQRKPRLFLACVKALAGLSRGSLAAIATGLSARAQEELAARMAEIEARLKEGDRDEP
jgi:hypothetical protein